MYNGYLRINVGPWARACMHALILIVSLFICSVNAADMEDVHSLLKQAKAEMQQISETSDDSERGKLLKTHIMTMQKLSAEFDELKSEGKLSGNSTLMADLMVYELKSLEAMISEIEDNK